nr:PREDICTED: serine/threonine-protein phosphatase 1 regulatory subunit 10 [Latimeria chalumnae]|eukprot:XP_014353691.1 PREDICTED: serine/threonine-protein phosphatase 1 regulatory subunit 10 [Latimeria chalumnae]
MGSGPIDPKELLKGLDCFLGKDGEVKTTEGMSKIYSLMKDSKKMVSRYVYLNILLHTRSQDILVRFIKVGGYRLLNNWLTYSKTTNNIPLLQQLLLTLQHLPLTVDHLKQNNTAKLVKQLSKSSEDEELRKLALVLVCDWMAVIRSQSNLIPAESDDVTCTCFPGLEMEAPPPAPVKKVATPVILSEKYNLKPMPLKRQGSLSGATDMPPMEKKYKPLNTVPNATKEIKVKIIPPQPMESTGFLEALNSAPIRGIKIKKKKKVMSPTDNKPSPFEGKTSTEPVTTKPLSPESSTVTMTEPIEIERPGTPVPAEEVSEPMETATAELSTPVEPKAEEPVSDAPQLTKKGKKKKTVSWPEESKLREYFYFELDETERVNVNKIKDFGEAAKREMMMDRQAFETARRLNHDAMEEKIPWSFPKLISLPPSLVEPGSNSHERFIQAEREKGILQEIFLTKDSVPDSPYEPDPESYEPSPPKLIPLDEDCSMDEGLYPDVSEAGPASQSPDSIGGAKLPPVLANLMGSMGKSPPPQTSNSSLNVQELFSSIMGGGQPDPKQEDLLKQPDFSDQIKHILGSLQNQAQGPGGPAPTPSQGLLGNAPVVNGFPPGPKNAPHYPPGGPGGPAGPFPGPHGGPGGPRMMSPPQQRDSHWDQPKENVRGSHHNMRGGGGGPYHRGRGRGGEDGYRGRGGRGNRSRNGPNNGMGNHGGDMSFRPVCRHFMMKGSCRYESNCAFYHPGINGPPLH